MPAAKDLTLHQAILGDIEGRIVSGEWPPGHRIPFEVELAAQYQCSRMTVNKVMTQLARAGLIERRKRSGSFVRQPMAQSAVLEIHDIRKEVEQLKLPYFFFVDRRTTRGANRDDMMRLDVKRGAPILDLDCLHRAGARPFCLEERLVSLDAVPDMAAADLSAVTPGQWLINQVPWNTAEHTIQAVSADSRVATILDIPEGSATLVIERRTWGAGKPVTAVRFTYPGARHALIARFSPKT